MALKTALVPMPKTRNPHNRTTKKKIAMTAGWLLLNGLGWILYYKIDAYIVSPKWVSGPEDEWTGIDQFAFWMTRSLPLMLGFLAWNVFTLWRQTQRGDALSLKFASVAVLAVWLVFPGCWGYSGHLVRLLANIGP